MELTGKIDRIDFSDDKKYFMIIDYKTGTAQVNLQEIFAGVNLQLLTYLMVTNKFEEVVGKAPAAMLYFFLKYPVKQKTTLTEATNEVDKELKPVGWLVEDKNIILNIDSSNQIIKAQFNKKDGTFNKSYAEKNLQTAENFQALMKFVDDILEETGKNILQGMIKALPFQSKKIDACKFCDYSELCDFNSKTDNCRTPDLDDNEKILEQIKKHKTGLNF